jgi:hypothetical protein
MLKVVQPQHAVIAAIAVQMILNPEGSGLVISGMTRGGGRFNGSKYNLSRLLTAIQCT